MSDKTQTPINLKLLAEVIHVYSVSHATQSNQNVHITFREEEDDNSSWFDLSIYEAIHLYKVWAKDKGYNVLSDYFGAYVTKLPKQSVNDCDFSSILENSEPKNIRLVCEELYDILKAENV